MICVAHITKFLGTMQLYFCADLIYEFNLEKLLFQTGKAYPFNRKQMYLKPIA